jgi:mannosyl-oligosaccharide alpha-1,2-mannosidase
VSPLAGLPSLFESSGYHSDIRSINWKEIPEHYPVESLLPLPTATPLQIPRIQHDFSGPELVNDRRTRLTRRNAIRQAFIHSWQGYRKNAWLHDEVKPVSGGYKDHFGGWGATLVDALGTLYIMDLHQDFTIAVADLRKVDFTIPRIESLNVFESTIRYLGGLMSAYDLSKGKYPILLEKAVELGEMLYHAFDTPNRLPVTRWLWERYLHFQKFLRLF